MERPVADVIVSVRADDGRMVRHRGVTPLQLH